MPKSQARRKEYSPEDDLEVIVRKLKLILNTTYKSIDNPTWPGQKKAYRTTTPDSISNIVTMVQTTSDTDLIPAFVNQNVRGTRTISLYKLDKAQDIVTYQPKQLDEDNPFEHSFSSFEMTEELNNLRDSDMFMGKFLTFIERETESFARSENIQLDVYLYNEGNHSNNLVLKLSGKHDIELVDLISMADNLHETIINKLSPIITNWSSERKLKYLPILDNISIIPDKKTALIPNKNHVAQLFTNLTRLSKKNHSLELKEIRQIYNILISIDDSHIKSKITQIVNNDIEIRKQKYKVDCKKELRQNIQFLLEEVEKNTTDDLKESIRAIILSEYNRLIKDDRNDFINGKIDYSSYVERNENYIHNIIDLW
jgi:hypothetical protein